MVFELSVKLQHNCIYLDYSEAFGNKQIYHYCSKFNDYLIVPGRLNDEQKLFTEFVFGKFDNLRFKQIGAPSEYTYVMFDCKCDELESNYITPKIRKLKGIPIFPHVYQNGWEYYKIFCKTKEIANDIVSMLENENRFKMISLSDLGDDLLITQSAILNQLITELTPKQLEVLTSAFEKGYYNIPRSIRTIDIAEKMGKTRYAVDKSLRSAENKIINYIMPFLYLHQSNVNIKPALLDKFP
ncbi:MAG: hypothetical protein HeimC3_03490 [Candidatus Heimdallarchaeota archaeon LC_3]|nr:MAG: hypothetical protein HeimC3_03490 [Candidatus Heimdallarchaeota archaeon LC_3]